MKIQPFFFILPLLFLLGACASDEMTPEQQDADWWCSFTDTCETDKSDQCAVWGKCKKEDKTAGCSVWGNCKQDATPECAVWGNCN